VISVFGVRSVFNNEARAPPGHRLRGAQARRSGRPPGAWSCSRTALLLGSTVVLDHGLGVFSMLAPFSASM